jgi:hypothetical protein
MKPDITAAVIHLVVPAAGLVWFLLLSWRLRKQGASVLLLHQLLVIFFCWGCLILVALTALFWHWSGLASLAVAFLIFLAPLALAQICWNLYHTKHPSAVQRGPQGWLRLLRCASFDVRSFTFIEEMIHIPVTPNQHAAANTRLIRAYSPRDRGRARAALPSRSSRLRG